MLKYTLITLLTLIPSLVRAQCGPCYAEVPANCKSAVLWSYPAFYLKGEYLYFTAREDGLKFAYSGGNSPFSYAVCHEGQVFDMNWKFNSGFRAGAGLLFDCSGWDLSVTYTQFNNCLNRCAFNTDLGTNLVKYWQTIPRRLLLIDQAQAHWRTKLNIIDLDIANEFFINDWFSMRPHFGAKGVWDRQHYCVDYFGYNFDDYTIEQRQHFWGAGPRIGFDVASHFGWCTAIFADMAFSALWSRYENCRNDCANYDYFQFPRSCDCCNDGCNNCNDGCNTCNSCNNGCNTCCNTCNNCCCDNYYSNNVFTAKSITRNLLPILECSVGLRWELPICGGCYVLRGIVAWEAQAWFEHNHFITLTPDTHRSLGLFTLQGLRAGGSIDF